MVIRSRSYRDAGPFPGRPEAARPRCLVVDDEADIRTLVRGFFVSKGWAVDEVASGADALASDPGVFDLIVLDQRMPGLTGYQTGVRLRRGGYSRPIIFYSAYVTPELERDLWRDLGPDIHLVSKPDLDHLIRVIEQLSPV